MRKILFLDIDGVVNNEKTVHKYSYRSHHGIDPELAFLVGKIQLDTDCEVVLSSSWRGHEDNHAIIKKQVVDFIDITPRCCTGIRGVEIYKWIQDNVPAADRMAKNFRYAILDDDSDMHLWQKDDFFKTSWKTGITPEIAQAVTKHLNDGDIIQ